MEDLNNALWIDSLCLTEITGLTAANYQIMVDISHLMVDDKPMLEGIFGNKTAEKVLIYIYHYGEAYASAISVDFGVALNPIRQQLDRFEGSGVLVSKEAGRTRLYSFNPKSPFASPVKQLIAVYYDSLSLSEKQKLFPTRRRPRRKGKPVK